jgi:hypothetical protein
MVRTRHLAPSREMSRLRPKDQPAVAAVGRIGRDLQAD